MVCHAELDPEVYSQDRQKIHHIHSASKAYEDGFVIFSRLYRILARNGLTAFGSSAG